MGRKADAAVSTIGIVNYGIGNGGSIANMFRKLRLQAEIVSTPERVASVQRLVLPGIGSFDACMEALTKSGLSEPVLQYAATGRPLLGICVGMQMLTLGSEEGNAPGLGLIRAHAKRLTATPGLRVPHIGWDSVTWKIPDHPLSRNLLDGSRFYFVHSYCVICESVENTLATCTYGEEFSAAIVRDHITGVQFHPEKSHRFGLQLLSNFGTA
jgi:imidazole glycerol-phosphate synthase subunit HisH